MGAARGRRRAIGVLALLGCTATNPCGATEEGGTSTIRFGLGIATLYDVDAYAGIEANWTPLPIPLIEAGRFSLFGPRAEWRLADGEAGTLSLLLGWDFAGFDAGDSDALVGLEDRPGSVLAGLAFARETTVGEITLGVRRDVGGEHGGTLATLGWERAFAFAGGRLAPGFELRWQSARYQQAYFGVSADEARPGLAAYRVDAGTDVEARLGWLRSVGARHRVLLDAVTTLLSNEAVDGPLIERRTSSRLALGWLYEF